MIINVTMKSMIPLVSLICLTSSNVNVINEYVILKC